MAGAGLRQGTGMTGADILQRPTLCERALFMWSEDFGRAYVLKPAAIKGEHMLERLTSGMKRDYRILQIISDTIVQDFTYRYLVLEDREGNVRAVQPFFLIRQDLLGGKRGPVRKALDAIRSVMPRFLTMQTLMVGSTVGEGALGALPEDEAWLSEALVSSLKRCGAEFRASLIVLKEFPSRLRPLFARFTERGYLRIPSMPYTALDLSFSNFEEYMQTRLSYTFRKNLRRKLKKTEGMPITMEAVTDITPFIDELYPLYLQVYERSDLNFEKLTREYLCRIGREAPDKTRFFIWRLSGRAVAFSVCSLHKDGFWDEYIGMDYKVALDLHLYFVTFRDLVNWCCANGVARYYSSALNYDPKYHLRFDLEPMDLYVRHTNNVVNRLFRLALPFLDPTRNDETIKKFRNSGEL
jgi:hypothetical protein